MLAFAGHMDFALVRSTPVGNRKCGSQYLTLPVSTLIGTSRAGPRIIDLERALESNFLYRASVRMLWTGPVKGQMFYPFGGAKMPVWKTRLVGVFLAAWFVVMALIDRLVN